MANRIVNPNVDPAIVTEKSTIINPSSIAYTAKVNPNLDVNANKSVIVNKKTPAGIIPPVDIQPDITFNEYVNTTVKNYLDSYTGNLGTATRALVADVANSVSYNNVVGRPTLALVATTGSYNNLIDLPTIPSVTGFATTSYVDTAITNLIGGAPAALDTLKELATSLNNNASYASTITTALSGKVNTTDFTWTNLGSKPTLFSGDYNSLTNRPTLDGLLSDQHQTITLPSDMVLTIQTTNTETPPMGTHNLQLSASEVHSDAVYFGFSSTNYQGIWIDETSKTIEIGNRESWPAKIIYDNATPAGKIGDIEIQTAGPFQSGGESSIWLTTQGSDTRTNHRWRFDGHGGLVFPDTTTQTTAWTGSLVNGALEVSLTNQGTLTTPSLFPITFNAVFDTAHCTTSLSLTDTAWDYDISFQINSDGTIETLVDGNRVWPSQPGYQNGTQFTYTTADHGIPDYTLTVTMSPVSAGPAGWGANINCSPPPQFPSTIESQVPIKLTSGSKSYRFGSDGNLYTPGSIKVHASHADIVLGDATATSGPGLSSTSTFTITTDRGGSPVYYTFDTSGKLILPSTDYLDSGTTTVHTDQDFSIGVSSPEKVWNFGSDSRLTLPGGAVLGDTYGDGGITLQSPANSYVELGSHDGNAYLWVTDYDYYHGADRINSAVYISTDYHNADHRWAFRHDGKLQLPSGGDIVDSSGTSVLGGGGGASTGDVTFSGVNVMGTGNLKLQPDSTAGGAYLDIFLTQGPDVHIATNTENLILGRDSGANVTIGVDGNVTVRTDNGTANEWKFSNDGWLSFPPKNNDYPGGGAIGNDVGTKSLQMTYQGNITINNEGGTWNFDTSGRLLLPSTNYIDSGVTTVLTNQDFSIGIGQNQVWNFDQGGDLTVPGNIHTNSVGFQFNSTITNVYLNGTDVYINLSDSPFGGPATGQVRISGVVGATQANGVWGYQATDNNQFRLFTDASTTTPVNGSGWGSYVSGGTAVGGTHKNLNVFVGNNRWEFGADGNLTLPAGGDIKDSTGISQFISVSVLKTLVADSTDFSDFQARIAAL